MFTGIIRHRGRVISISKKKDIIVLEIKPNKKFLVSKGDSVSINGVCSTVMDKRPDSFKVEYMVETQKRTTVKDFKLEDNLNLEKSLKLSDLVDGHLVTGHVDVKGTIEFVQGVPPSRMLGIKVPREYISFIAPKGSIAVDGVGLTPIESGNGIFTVALVPYTLSNTNLGDKVKGDIVNVEIDILAKYMAQLIGLRVNIKKDAKKKTNQVEDRK
ncbi:MAG: riboflavin synthase [Parcubacteria group bacterium CG11_big_fil_rev_8_21_14_0_20_39_22]|nr:MAG: riboflavin synthase [Parcubacteria group bacterium CG11_big_fil_rev_8_21_14_0_20_39_22]